MRILRAFAVEAAVVQAQQRLPVRLSRKFVQEWPANASAPLELWVPCGWRLWIGHRIWVNFLAFAGPKGVRVGIRAPRSYDIRRAEMT